MIGQGFASRSIKSQNENKLFSVQFSAEKPLEMFSKSENSEKAKKLIRLNGKMIEHVSLSEVSAIKFGFWPRKRVKELCTGNELFKVPRKI